MRFASFFPVDLLLGSNKSTGKETGKMHLCAACRNLKIYSACNETPKLHLSEDRRYFSGVRDLAFASIRISSAPFRKSNGTSFVRKGRGTSEAV